MKKSKFLLTALALVLCVLSAAAFSGCEKKPGYDYILYADDAALKKAVKVGNYEKLTLDRTAEDFQAAYREMLSADIESGDFYDELTAGEVAMGDIAKIDYTGKKNGVPFEGGTATDHDLEIGSGSFIPGFEEGLVGVKIGGTEDLNLTFPEDYQAAELAGQAVVFTVTVHSVRRPQQPEKYCAKLGVPDAGTYIKEKEALAAKELLLDMVVKDTEVKEYPEAEYQKQLTAMKEQMDFYYQANYNMTLADYLKQVNSDEATFEKQLTEQMVYPQMQRQMAAYAIARREKLEMTAEKYDAVINELLAENSSATREQVLEYYGDYAIEAEAVARLVKDYLYDNATIK